MNRPQFGLRAAVRLQGPPNACPGLEIASRFGGVEQLREAVNELQTLLYAA